MKIKKVFAKDLGFDDRSRISKWVYITNDEPNAGELLMKPEQILLALRNGKNIRKKDWATGLSFNLYNSDVKVYINSTDYIRINLADFLDGNWEICESKPNETAVESFKDLKLNLVKLELKSMQQRMSVLVEGIQNYLEI
jgi:hypothetical protein